MKTHRKRRPTAWVPWTDTAFSKRRVTYVLLHLKVRCAELSIFYLSQFMETTAQLCLLIITTQTAFSVLFWGTAFELGSTFLTRFTLQWLDQDG